MGCCHGRVTICHLSVMVLLSLKHYSQIGKMKNYKKLLFQLYKFEIYINLINNMILSEMHQMSKLEISIQKFFSEFENSNNIVNNN